MTGPTPLRDRVFGSGSGDRADDLVRRLTFAGQRARMSRHTESFEDLLLSAATAVQAAIEAQEVVQVPARFAVVDHDEGGSDVVALNRPSGAAAQAYSYRVLATGLAPAVAHDIARAMSAQAAQAVTP